MAIIHRWSENHRPPCLFIEGSSVSVDEQHVAFPKLFGAPAYARPPSAAESTERPFDPDDLPLIAELTPEERAQYGASDLVARAGIREGYDHGTYAVPGAGGATVGGLGGTQPALHARPFALRALADRLRGRGPRS